MKPANSHVPLICAPLRCALESPARPSSRVINGSPVVTEQTAKHVRRILQELNFIPNPVATTLKYAESNTYGLIIPDLTKPVLSGVSAQFRRGRGESDYELLLATTQSSEPKLIGSVRRMLMRRVDGVVLMASEYDTRLIEPLFDHKIPIVTVDRRQAQTGAGDVAIDFEMATASRAASSSTGPSKRSASSAATKESGHRR